MKYRIRFNEQVTAIEAGSFSVKDGAALFFDDGDIVAAFSGDIWKAVVRDDAKVGKMEEVPNANKG